MFTGIVQHLGTVVAAEPAAFGRRLSIDAGGWTHHPEPGDSVAVNGCCLTVTGAADGRLDFDVIHQTLRATTLGDLAAGARVNLEPPVTPSTLLGGHLVQGHVDGVAAVSSAAGEPERRLRIEVPGALREFIVDKGSIAVDGVSLTVAALGEDWFEVALIPETLERTTLGAATEGAKVNLETDYIVKAVVGWLRGRAS